MSFATEATRMSALLSDPTLTSHPHLRDSEVETDVELEPAELFEFRKAWDRTWVVIPPAEDPDTPAIARRLRDIATWTQWSDRQLADLLGTTHPTIGAARRGREITRVPALADRIAALHRVIERVSMLCDRDVSEVTRLLEAAPSGRPTAVDLIGAGEFSNAYLAVLDARAPTRDGLMGSDLPRRQPGTIAIEDLNE